MKKETNNLDKCKIVEIDKYDKQHSPTFSPDGKSFVFVAEKNGKWIIVRETYQNGETTQEVKEKSDKEIN